jgi:hypothetical protein
MAGAESSVNQDYVTFLLLRGRRKMTRISCHFSAICRKMTSQKNDIVTFHNSASLFCT